MDMMIARSQHVSLDRGAVHVARHSRLSVRFAREAGESTMQYVHVLAVGSALATLAGCVQPGPAESEQPREFATLGMPLVTQANGVTYRLREATFNVSGPVSVLLSSDTDPLADAITATLPTGDYTVLLEPGWTLTREDASGIPDPVQPEAFCRELCDVNNPACAGALTCEPLMIQDAGVCI
jgi:hypothetical protein